MSASRKVARNSIWLAIEAAFGAGAIMFTSVLLARHYGPDMLADYNLLVWMTYVAGALGTIGIPSMAQKYMAEYLGKGEPGVAYRVYKSALGTQISLALGLWVVGQWLVAWGGYGWIGFWLVTALVPRAICFLPSQINMATEEFRRNVGPAFAANMTSVAVILASIWFGWGILGLALSHVAGHTLELALKVVTTQGRLVEWKANGAPPLDPTIKRRMRRYAFHGVGLLLLNIVVWDRSDLILLKFLQPDKRQITFFSYAFTMVDKLLLVPQSAGGALGLNLMTQYGRDHGRVASTAVSSSFYLLLVGLPVLLGAVAVSGPVWMIYGPRFAPAVPVFVIMALFAIPRMILLSAQSLLQATENQGFLLWSGCVAGVVKLGLDLILIPSSGALGAAVGNGAGQALAAIGTWTFIIWRFRPEVRLDMLARMSASALAMTAAAMAVTHWLPPVPGVVLGILTGAIVYFLMLRLTSALSPVDRDRLLSIAQIFPASLRSFFNRLLWALIPRAASAEI